MPRAPRPRLANGVYHVTARGNRGEEIFTSDSERRRFVHLLAKNAQACGWQCFAYCLMTNHFHLLVATPRPNLPEGMHGLNSAYARWFNWRHGFEGHLFQRRYHASLIESDHHMLESCRYVLLNPVRARLSPSPCAWRWSSYRATVGLDRKPRFLALDPILVYFGRDVVAAREAFRRFVLDAPGLGRPF